MAATEIIWDKENSFAVNSAIKLLEQAEPLIDRAESELGQFHSVPSVIDQTFEAVGDLRYDISVVIQNLRYVLHRYDR